MKHYTLLLLLLLCACCASPPAKVRIFRAEPLEPEAWYRLVYESVQDCADKFGKKSEYDFGDVEWFIVKADVMPGLAGLTSFPNRIYLDERWVTNAQVIRHESGHVGIVPGDNMHESPTFMLCTGTLPPDSTVAPNH